MKTPICDFAARYAASNALRLHMPGHKGISMIGPEPYDITEIHGADSLYQATGIIRESEANASLLFGCETFYSTEGSSLCIRAMLYLALLHARQTGKKPLIVAGRNAHRAFLSAVALLDLDIMWLYPWQIGSYLSCELDAQTLETLLTEGAQKPTAVYLTSPDYLGNTVDLKAISEVCCRCGVLLLVDNAHGAYLKFLPQSRHPIDLGADLCCDSAHKTLPVLTGGAYLHIAPKAPALCSNQAKEALALFGSTSPSYLILQSLDKGNKYLADGYPERLCSFIVEVQRTKDRLKSQGYALQGDEPLKLTISAKGYGYRGEQLNQLLLEQHIICEFFDPDFVVMMLTPEIGKAGLQQLEQALRAIPRRPIILEEAPICPRPERAISVRQAILSPREVISVSESAGRILAETAVGCPPAVPIVVCGERIASPALSCFSYYGITDCAVVIESC